MCSKNPARDRFPKKHRLSCNAGVSAATFAIALALPIASLLAQDCPTSCLFGSLATDPRRVCTTESSSQRSLTAPCLRNSWAKAAYDTKMGRVSADVREWDCTASVSADVVAADRFRIVGPATSTEFELTAQLHCVGHNQGEVIRACLAESGDTPAFVSLLGTLGSYGVSQVDSTLVVRLRHPVGDEFELRYGASAYARAEFPKPTPGTLGGLFIGLSADLSFSELPAGYSVVSCQGHVSAVAVTPTTWRLLKSRYR